MFLFNDGDRLADAKGYCADITRDIQKRLNFTDVLVANTGFGAYRNGSWNGMVGDLLYGVSFTSQFVTEVIYMETSFHLADHVYTSNTVAETIPATGKQHNAL